MSLLHYNDEDEDVVSNLVMRDDDDDASSDDDEDDQFGGGILNFGRKFAHAVKTSLSEALFRRMEFPTDLKHYLMLNVYSVREDPRQHHLMNGTPPHILDRSGVIFLPRLITINRMLLRSKLLITRYTADDPITSTEVFAVPTVVDNTYTPLAFAAQVVHGIRLKKKGGKEESYTFHIFCMQYSHGDSREAAALDNVFALATGLEKVYTDEFVTHALAKGDAWLTSQDNHERFYCYSKYIYMYAHLMDDNVSPQAHAARVISTAANRFARMHDLFSYQDASKRVYGAETVLRSMFNAMTIARFGVFFKDWDGYMDYKPVNADVIVKALLDITADQDVSYVTGGAKQIINIGGLVVTDPNSHAVSKGEQVFVNPTQELQDGTITENVAANFRLDSRALHVNAYVPQRRRNEAREEGQDMSQLIDALRERMQHRTTPAESESDYDDDDDGDGDWQQQQQDEEDEELLLSSLIASMTSSVVSKCLVSMTFDEASEDAATGVQTLNSMQRQRVTSGLSSVIDVEVEGKGTTPGNTPAMYKTVVYKPDKSRAMRKQREEDKKPVVVKNPSKDDGDGGMTIGKSNAAAHLYLDGFGELPPVTSADRAGALNPIGKGVLGIAKQMVQQAAKAVTGYQQPPSVLLKPLTEVMARKGLSDAINHFNKNIDTIYENVSDRMHFYDIDTIQVHEVLQMINDELLYVSRTIVGNFGQQVGEIYSHYVGSGNSVHKDKLVQFTYNRFFLQVFNVALIASKLSDNSSVTPINNTKVRIASMFLMTIIALDRVMFELLGSTSYQQRVYNVSTQNQVLQMLVNNPGHSIKVLGMVSRIISTIIDNGQDIEVFKHRGDLRGVIDDLLTNEECQELSSRSGAVLIKHIEEQEQPQQQEEEEQGHGLSRGMFGMFRYIGEKAGNLMKQAKEVTNDFLDNHVPG